MYLELLENKMLFFFCFLIIGDSMYQSCSLQKRDNVFQDQNFQEMLQDSSQKIFKENPDIQTLEFYFNKDLEKNGTLYLYAYNHNFERIPEPSKDTCSYFRQPFYQEIVSQPSCALYGEFDPLPIFEETDKKEICFFQKVIHRPTQEEEEEC